MNWLGGLRRLKAMHAARPLLDVLERAARFKRRLVVLAAAVTVGLGAFAMLAMLPAVTAPAAVPVAVAGTVLGAAAELFGGTSGPDTVTGEEIVQAGRSSDLTCKPQDVPAPVTTATTAPLPGPAVPVDPDAETGTDEVPAAAPPEPIAPVPVNRDGSISRADAQLLIDPVPPKTSALIAQVWFLYRLAGVGNDWPAFIADYRAAGLRGDDEAADAPLAQVQTLNHAGVPVEGYRLTAASLAAAGLYTGRFSDSHPGYREAVMAELVTGCLQGDTGLEESREKLPPASVTSSVPSLEPNPAAVPEAALENKPEPDAEPGS